MVNPRFSRRVNELKGLARVVAEKNMMKSSPPFYQFQLKTNVREEDRVKDMPFVVGDRVQMTKGPDKNKIGIIRALYESGNSYIVEGIGGTERLVLPRELWYEGQTKPVVNFPKPVSYKDLRLVTKMKNEDGTEEDVVIHSLELKGTFYDKHTNQIRPIRRAKHDHSIVVPYPRGEPVKPTESQLATAADVVDERTNYVTSIIDHPIPIGALNQVRNPYSKYRWLKNAPKLAESDLKWATPKSMPTTPATKELLAKLAELPPKHKTPFTKDIEKFIGEQVKQGLQNRSEKETEALKQYN